MRTRVSRGAGLLTAALVAVTCSNGARAQNGAGSDDAVITIKAQLAVEKGAGAQGAGQADEPTVFYSDFAKSTRSIARSDLLTPRVPDTKLEPIADLSVDALAATLNGTWVRRLTMNGIPIETDSFYYFKLDRGTGTALLIDRLNQGADNEARFPAKTGAVIITFVSRKFQIVDQYAKTSPLSNNITAGALGAVPLDQALNKLASANFFTSVPELDQEFVNKAQSGMFPNAEQALPSTTGGSWKVTLAATPEAERRDGHPGVKVILTGEVRSNEVPNGVPEQEGATFYKFGEFFVSDNWVVRVGKDQNSLEEMFRWDRVVIGRRPQPVLMTRTAPVPPPRVADASDLKAATSATENDVTPEIGAKRSGIGPHRSSSQQAGDRASP